MTTRRESDIAGHIDSTGVSGRSGFVKWFESAGVLSERKRRYSGR
jgi:hypothetical protein